MLKVLFLFQSENNWLSLQSLFELMQESQEFEPSIIKVPTSQKSDFSQLPESDYITNKGLTFIDGRNKECLKGLRFDAAICSLPYDNVRPEHLRAVALKNIIKHLFYIPYALDIDMGYLDNKTYRYQHDIYQFASAIFARSEFVKRDITDTYPKLTNKVYVTGLPRFDLLRDLTDFSVDNSLVEQIAGRTAFLWNTHHSIGLHGTSTFGEIGVNLMCYAAQNNIALIWRPHPGFFSTLKNYGLMKNYEIIRLKQEITELGIILDERPDFRHSFKASDALISDGGSFVLDYLLTQKPMLIHKSKTFDLLASNEAKLLLSHLTVSTELEQTINFIEAQLNMNQFANRKKAKNYPVDKFLSGVDGQASEAILNVIQQVLKA